MSSRVEISKRLVLVNAASSVIARVVNISVLVWLNQYLLRRISTEEYSLIPVLTAVVALLPLFTSVLTSGIGRFVLEAYAKGDDRGITQIVSTMLPLLLLAGAVILMGGLAVSWYVDKILTIPADRLWDARIMMALLTLSAAVQPPCAAFSAGIYVRQKFVLQNLMHVGDQLLRLFLLFVLLFGISTRVLWVVVANVGAQLALSVATVVVSRRLVPALRFRVEEIHWEHARRLISFGGWTFIGIFAYRMRQTAIPLILNKMVALSDVTMYHIGSLPRRQLDQWGEILGAPLSPVVTGMHAMGAKTRIQSLYLRSGRIALWAALLVALPAALYAETIIRLYVGTRFAEAAVIMVLVLAGLPVTNGTYMIWQVAIATGRVRATGIYALITQVVSIVGVYCVAGRLGWGATGVALVLFATAVLSAPIALWPLGLRLAGVEFGTWVRQTLIPGLTPACVAAVVWMGLDIAYGPDSWIGVGLCTLAGMLCYAGVLFGYCLEPRDKEDLAKGIARVRALI